MRHAYDVPQQLECHVSVIELHDNINVVQPEMI